MIINGLLGYIAHYFKEYITGHMSLDWDNTINKVLGVLYVFPLSYLMFNWLEIDIPKPNLRFLVTYALSFMSFGIGVVIGTWQYPAKVKK